MDILNYFLPINKSFLGANKFEKGFLGETIKNTLQQFDINNCQIALMGINEARNSLNGKFDFNTYNIRKSLYSLTAFKQLKIVDFGDIKLGNTLADTYAAIKQIIEIFIEKNIIPIIFGGTQEISIPIIETLLNTKQKPIEISFIDALFDYTENQDFHSKSYFNHSALSNNNTIKTIIGYQSYLNSTETENIIKEKGFDTYRLGLIRNNINSIEPILRDSDLLSFDLSAIRQSDSPQNIFKSPNGLYAEEACQLAYLSGISDKVKCFTISEIISVDNEINQSEHLMSQIIWHFLQGLSLRQKDYPIKEISSYKKIYVQNEKINQELVFYQNKKNNRFWLQIPKENTKEDIEIISCSETDYKTVCLNEIPKRIWRRISNSL